jgi:hypothetical protein
MWEGGGPDSKPRVLAERLQQRDVPSELFQPA